MVESVPRWLLLIHQIPPKPDYLRVKIGRRLQRVGAVAIKNSVYVLPPSAAAHEDFQWIVREIEEGGGGASGSEAALVGEGLTGDAIRARFEAAARYTHRKGELRFDMFEAEYTHVGDACTFETLVSTFLSSDAALREIAEIVHDVDCKDAKFRREEAAGLARMIAGIALLHA